MNSAEHPPLWLFDHAPIMGGAEVFALGLARSAARDRGLRVRLVCPPDSELAARGEAEGLEQLAARFPPLGPRGAPRWPDAVLAHRRLLAGLDPGAIAVANTARAQAYLTAAFPLLRKHRRPALVHVLHEQETLGRRSGRLALRRVGSLVAIGENVASLCRARLPGVPVTKANNFLEPHRFNGDLPKGVREGKPVIGVIARMIPEKGLLELVDELADAGSWSRALIAADEQDAPYADLVRRRLASHGLEDRIGLVGWIDDVEAFLSSVDVLVVPSTGNEGQPTVILEALAVGVPCLVRPAVWSSDYDGLPVYSFDSAAELERRLAELPPQRTRSDDLRLRFGPEQALDAVLRSAAASR